MRLGPAAPRLPPPDRGRGKGGSGRGGGGRRGKRKQIRVRGNEGRGVGEERERGGSGDERREGASLRIPWRDGGSGVLLQRPRGLEARGRERGVRGGWEGSAGRRGQGGGTRSGLDLRAALGSSAARQLARPAGARLSSARAHPSSTRVHPSRPSGRRGPVCSPEQNQPAVRPPSTSLPPPPTPGPDEPQ